MSRSTQRRHDRRLHHARRPRRLPTLGLAVIARDEGETLPQLLASIEGAFDQVVLVDTGSLDDTVAVFECWASRTGQPHVVDSFEWVDDFAAARSAADRLLTTDWTCWADADDVILGAENLRGVVARAPLEVAALAADYDYLHGDDGECEFTMWRERLVRRHAGVWVGRVHEHKAISGGGLRLLDRRVAVWVHRKTRAQGDVGAWDERDRRIFQRWQAEAPDDPMLLAWMATGTNPAALDWAHDQ